tara:strand:+ start:414 stop:689 length:276 start_codon:yes stop_codon:yes gene_type:complete
MTKFLVITILGLLFSQNAYSHSGMTGPSGCHMDYSRGTQHCHKSKQPDPFKTYYYIKYQGKTAGPYSSYNSCMNAARGAKLTGAYCSTSKY